MAWLYADDGTRLFVQALGSGSTTVVLTHGYAQSGRCWWHQVSPLVAAGFRVVVWDLRSHGRSDEGPAGAWTLDRLADDLARVVEEFAPGPVVLVGHSMGGMTMMALAERRPDLVADRVRGVGLLATAATGAHLAWLGLPPRATVPVQRFAVRLFGALAPRRRAWWLVRAAGPVGLAGVWTATCGWGTSAADLRRSVEMARGGGFVVLERFLEALFTHDRTPALATYRGLPALVLNGGADLLVPDADAEELAALLPGCRRVRIPRAGHNIMLAAPRRTSEELVWLATEAAGSRTGEA